MAETEEKPKAQNAFGAHSIQPTIITMLQFNQPGLASAAARTQSGDKLKKKKKKKSIAFSASYVRSGIFSESQTIGWPTAGSRLEVMRV